MDFPGDQRLFFGDPPICRSDAVRWKVLRIKPNLDYRARCLSSKLIWSPVHYYRGRSVPCMQNGCKVCVDLTARWYVFMPVVFVKNNQPHGQAILELPSGAALNLGGEIAKVLETSGEPWLGVQFLARRANKSARSPVVCNLESLGNSVVEVDRLEVMATLCRMWGVPVIDESTDETAWRETVTQRLDSDEHYARGKATSRRTSD